MKYLLSCAVLFLATTILAQPQGQPPPTTNPPYQTTPPTFPEGQTPKEQMPPDTQAPPPQTTTSNRQVEEQILQQFNAEPSLSGTNIDARVGENSVVLIGSVKTLEQHDLAVRIAQDNAAGRKIIDKINVKQQT
jgi:BON domain